MSRAGGAGAGVDDAPGALPQAGMRGRRWRRDQAGTTTGTGRAKAQVKWVSAERQRRILIPAWGNAPETPRHQRQR